MKKILVIDDNQLTRTTLENLLTKADFKVISAEDGMEGVQKLKKSIFDLVLLDIVMPGFDGEQVLLVMKKLNNVPPVLIVSGHLTKERFVKLSKAGARGFLAKPVDPQKLYQLISQVLEEGNKPA